MGIPASTSKTGPFPILGVVDDDPNVNRTYDVLGYDSASDTWDVELSSTGGGGTGDVTTAELNTALDNINAPNRIGPVAGYTSADDPLTSPAGEKNNYFVLVDAITVNTIARPANTIMRLNKDTDGGIEADIYVDTVATGMLQSALSASQITKLDNIKLPVLASESTSDFTATLNNSHGVDTRTASVVVTIPAGTFGDQIIIMDKYAACTSAKTITVNANANGLIAEALVINEPGGWITLQWIDSQYGWLATESKKPVGTVAPITATTTQELLVMNAGDRIGLKKVLTEAFNVKGLVHAPIDGTTETNNRIGTTAEWEGNSLPAIKYTELDNGEFLEIVPEGQYDVVQIRDGWQGLLNELSLNNNSSVTYSSPVTGNLILKNNASPNPAADINVLLKQDYVPPGDSTVYTIGSSGGTGSFPAAQYDKLVHHWGAATIHYIGPAGTDVSLADDGVVHFATADVNVNSDISLDGVTLDLDLLVPDPTNLTVSIIDILDKRRSVMTATFKISADGNYKIDMDFPTQVAISATPVTGEYDLADTVTTPRFVVTVKSSKAITIESTTTIELHKKTKAQGMAEAIKWRKYLMRGLFSNISESRPWLSLDGNTTVTEQVNALATGEKEALSEYLGNMEILRTLDDTDALVNEYYDWTYQTLNADPTAYVLPSETAGAPTWARKAHATMTELMYQADWWMDNRNYEGLLGGGIQDDTDFYQAYQFIPFIDDDVIGPKVKTNGTVLADAAWNKTLTNGLNTVINDHLHAYEDGVNQLALMLRWHRGDSLHQSRALTSAQSVANLLYDAGNDRWHFPDVNVNYDKSVNGYDAADIADTGGSAYYHPAWLLWHTAYEYLLQATDATLLADYKKWAQTWLDYQTDAFADTSTSDNFPDKVTISTGATVTSNQGGGPIEHWMALNQITGEQSWLDGVEESILTGGYTGFSNAYGRNPISVVEWPAKETTVDTRMTGSSGYLAYHRSGDLTDLDARLDEGLAWHQKYRNMQTTAHQKTDRVLNIKTQTAVAMYLGDAPYRNQILNLMAVSYEGVNFDDFAGLVIENYEGKLRIAIHAFNAISGDLRLWRMPAGTYTLDTGDDTTGDLLTDANTTSTSVTLADHDKVSLSIAAGTTHIIDIR